MYTIYKKLTRMGSQVGFTFDKTMKMVSEINEGDRIEVKVAKGKITITKKDKPKDESK